MVMIFKIVKLLLIEILIKSDILVQLLFYNWINIVKYVINISNLRVNVNILNQMFIQILINVNIWN